MMLHKPQQSKHNKKILIENINNKALESTLESRALQYYYLDGEYFVCIDVECAAIGYGHFDSYPCRIGMVDFYGNILFDSGPIFVPNLVDPLTEFTGLSSYDIVNAGKFLENLLIELHNRLFYLNKLYKHGVTIIGQSISMDIVWTNLRR
eukprot:873485_1